MNDSRQKWQERRAATLKDVARSVGVSESLASRVLNGSREGTRISLLTRQAVVEAAKRLGYRPNELARSLNTGRSNRLGLYAGTSPTSTGVDPRQTFCAELMVGMFRGAQECGMNTLVHTTGNGQNQLMDLASSKMVDGLVVFAGPNDAFLQLLGELRMPTVAIADRIDSIPSVCVDDRQGAMLQIEHLAERGHRHVILKQSPQPSHTARTRIDSFAELAGDYNIKISYAPEDISSPDRIGEEDMRLLIEGHTPATAIVCWNDFVAASVCQGLENRGLSVPRDVAVIGFDGFESFMPAKYHLTTIRAPWAESTRIGVHLLLDMIAGESVPMLTTLPVEFVRGSTT